MKKILRIFIVVGLLCTVLPSCTKTKSDLEVALSNLSNLSNLSSNTNYVKIWKMTGYHVNQVSQTLTVAQQNYTISFNQNGTFVDNGGYAGTWQMPDTATLTTVYTNLPNGPLSQNYRLILLTGSLLILQYTSNGNTILTSYAQAN